MVLLSKKECTDNMDMKIRPYLSYLVILVFIGILPLFSLFVSGLPVTHDGQDHVARIANFYQSISEGNMVPRWAGNLNWGYGHPILMFLYPLSSYMATLFHAVGFGYVDSVKLVFGVSFVASIAAMYIWLSNVYGKKAGFVGALLYGFAPYRFVDLYVRGAIGEHVAFIFPPLVCFFMYRLSQKSVMNSKNHFYQLLTTNYLSFMGFSLSLAGLILAHNAISLMFLPVFLLYGTYLFFTQEKRSLAFMVTLVLGTFFGFGLSAFFWAPAFLEGKYTLRDIVTAGGVEGRFVPSSWFLYSPWNYGQGNEITKSLGFGSIIGVFAGLYFAVKGRLQKTDRVFVSISLFLLIVGVFLMTQSSKFVWDSISLLQKFQFPWRFLSLTTFLTAIIGAVGISQALQKDSSKNKILYLLFCLVIIIPTVQMWKPKGHLIKPESFYTGIYDSTTDTGESSPIWSVRFMEHRSSYPIEIIGGEGTIETGPRTSTKHTYTVTATTPVRILENTLYFPGWEVIGNGKSVPVQFQDPAYRGLMTFELPVGRHAIEVIFRDTRIRQISNIISMVSGFLLIAGFGGWYVWHKK